MGMTIIKNYEMPHNCYDCDLHNYHECDLTSESIEEDYCWNGDSREKHCPLREVDAIPRADYENRLKADLVAAFTDLQLEIVEMDSGCGWEGYRPTAQIIGSIQQRINDLAVPSGLEKNSKKLEKDFGESDCINRAELLKAMDTWDKFGYTETGCFVREPKGDYVPYVRYEDIVNCVKGMPSVTPQPRKGHWIRISPAEIYECSECGQNVMTSDICVYKFCHGCGIKMVEPQESEDKE